MYFLMSIIRIRYANGAAENSTHCKNELSQVRIFTHPYSDKSERSSPIGKSGYEGDSNLRAARLRAWQRQAHESVGGGLRLVERANPTIFTVPARIRYRALTCATPLALRPSGKPSVCLSSALPSLQFLTFPEGLDSPELTVLSSAPARGSALSY